MKTRIDGEGEGEALVQTGGIPDKTDREHP